MTKSINMQELRTRLRDLEQSYGPDVNLTIDKDLNIEVFTDPDLSEETPEESQKRAERQGKELKNDERYTTVDDKAAEKRRKEG